MSFQQRRLTCGACNLNQAASTTPRGDSCILPMKPTSNSIYIEHGSTKFPKASILASSQCLNWSGIYAERRAHPAGDISDILPRITELALALQGNTRAIVNRRMGGERRRTVAASGTQWLCPEGYVDDSISISGELPDVLHLYLPRSLFTTLSHEDGFPDVRPEDLQYKAGFVDPLIESLARAIGTELASPSIFGRMFVESSALTLALRLLQAHSATYHRRLNDVVSALALDDVRLRRVIDFIEAHLEDEIGVNDLAGIACLSPFYFSRAFKRATGLPPYQYLAKRRIAHAKNLLLEPNLSIDEIARRCQFATPSGFTRAFTLITGQTPRRFRQSARL